MIVRISALAGLTFMVGVSAHGPIFSGTGFGTYYHDVKHVDACGASFAAQNTGPLECESETALSLDQVNSNYVLAMNHSQLILDMAKYCGKGVVVTVNGKRSDLPLFIGDGCQRCASGSPSSDIWNSVGAPGLDFSYSVLEELSGGSACADGHVPISWEILDDTIYSFSTSESSISTSVAARITQSVWYSAPVMSTTVSSVKSLYTPVTNSSTKSGCRLFNPSGKPRYNEQPPKRSLSDRGVAMQWKHS